MNKTPVLALCGLSLSLLCACGTSSDAQNAGTEGEASQAPVQSVSSAASSQTGTPATEGLIFETTWDSPTPVPETSASRNSGPDVEVETATGWNRIDDSFFLAKFTKETASFLVAEESFFSATDPDTVVLEAKQMLTGVFDEVVFEGETDNRIVDGSEGRHFLVSYVVNGIPMTASYTYLSINGSVYSCILSDTSDLWPEVFPEEEALLAGVKIN